MKKLSHGFSKSTLFSCISSLFILLYGLAASSHVSSKTYSLSEEDSASSCQVGQLLSSFSCSGHYCDNLEFTCTDALSVEIGRQYWSKFVSEEYPSARYCRSGFYVSGFKCDGHYCDNISMQCSEIVDSDKDVSCFESNWISDETLGVRINVEKESASFVTGLRCDGKYCDNKKLRFCNVSLEKKVSISGVAAYGDGWPFKEVCAKPLIDNSSLESLDDLVSCSITDARGGFLIENLQDKVDNAKELAFMLRVKTKGEPRVDAEDDEYTYSFNDQFGIEEKVANINELTDVVTDAFTRKASFFKPPVSDCYQADECLTHIARELKKQTNSFERVKKSFSSFLSNIIPEDRDIFTDQFIPDPLRDPVDAALELLNIDIVGDELVVESLSGVSVSSFELDDVGKYENTLSERAILALKEGAGGDRNQKRTASTYVLCNKQAEGPFGQTSIGNMCMKSKQLCTEIGGVPSEYYYKNQSACQRFCWDVNEKIFQIRNDQSSSTIFENTPCFTDIKVFKGHNKYQELKAHSACQLGVSEACDEMKYSQELGKTFLLTSTENDPTGNSIRFDWSTIENARGYRLYQTSKNGVPERRLQKRVDAKEGEGLNKITWNANGYYQPETRYCFVVETYNDVHTTTSEELCTETIARDDSSMSEILVADKSSMSESLVADKSSVAQCGAIPNGSPALKVPGILGRSNHSFSPKDCMIVNTSGPRVGQLDYIRSCPSGDGKGITIYYRNQCNVPINLKFCHKGNAHIVEGIPRQTTGNLVRNNNFSTTMCGGTEGSGTKLTKEQRDLGFKTHEWNKDLHFVGYDPATDHHSNYKCPVPETQVECDGDSTKWYTGR